MGMPRILVLGDAGRELILKTMQLPRPGKSLRGDRFGERSGGSGVSLAVALARLQNDAVLSGAIGDDGNGRELLCFLKDERVDARFLSVKRGYHTPLSVIIREEGCDERRLYYPDAATKYGDIDVEEAFICYPDAVLLRGDLPELALEEALRLSKEQGLPLFVMGLPAGDYPLSHFDGCHLLLVDENEIASVTGIRPIDQESCMKSCMALMQRVRTSYIVLRLEERGCFIYDGKYHTFLSSYEVPLPAGESADCAFAAALVTEHLRSHGDIKRSCEFALIVSALYLTRGGGFRGYPSRNDIQRFIERNELDFVMSEEIQEETEDEL